MIPCEEKQLLCFPDLIYISVCLPVQAPLASSYSSYVAGPVVQCEVEGTQENVEGIKSVIFKLHEYYGSECRLGGRLWDMVGTGR